MTEAATNVTISLEIKPLGEVDVELLESLVANPVFGALKRIYLVERVTLLNQLANESDAAVIRTLQGKIQGITMLENLPMVLKKYRGALDVSKKKAEDKARQERRRGERPAQ